ncbi:MAG: aspartyl-tRNA(Asn)/glutamyl-tRNA(Gln) amidotransferase subunit B [Candidatus Omnitrophota bacterium]|jgi:aspartyl-tRNA(Asn)/glutamyl-tRNA(Gln) amidotransferase subunit B
MAKKESKTVDYDIVIGLEVHCQLASKTKIFCGCSTEFGKTPNSQVCPVCAGLPGTLPVLNEKVFEYGMRAILALGGKVAPLVKFDRKNYFYPDLPKGYQISQFDKPIGVGGGIEIENEGGPKFINLTRLHLEEDAGKLTHQPNGESLVDLNRAGVPLAEIVSEPELKTPEEAYQYLTNMKAILKASGVSNCDMEKGQLRCDANISLRKTVNDPFGDRAEIKNVNSFKYVRAALEYEIQRQAKILDEGETIIQETRLWNAAEGKTYSMRTKENAHDYRYFPDPDLVPFEVDMKMVQSIKESMPELPAQKCIRLVEEFGLSPYDTKQLVTHESLCILFEQLATKYKNYKSLVNWLLGVVAAAANEKSCEIDGLGMDADQFIEILELVDAGTISLKVAKEEVFPVFLKEHTPPQAIIKAKGLAQISDVGAIEKQADEVIANNPKSVSDYKSGKTNALMFLVGQVMRGSKGKANPNMVKEMLEKKLS